MAAALAEELGAAGRADAPPARGRRRGRRSVRARPGGGRGRGRRRGGGSRRSTSCSPRPRAAHRRAAPLPLPPPARPHGRLRRRRPAAGCSARTSAARTRSPSAVPRPRRARTTWSTPRGPATPTRWRSSARPAARRLLRAPASAARWFGAALRAASGRRSPEERLGLLLARAAALAATGQLEESRADLLETLALVPEDAVETWVQLTVACAGVEHMLGRHDLAQAGSPRRSSACPIPRPPRPSRSCSCSRSTACSARTTTPPAAWGARALEAARPLGDTPLIAHRGRHGRPGRGLQRRGGRDRDACGARSSRWWTRMSDEELARRPDAAGYLAAPEL